MSLVIPAPAAAPRPLRPVRAAPRVCARRRSRGRSLGRALADDRRLLRLKLALLGVLVLVAMALEVPL